MHPENTPDRPRELQGVTKKPVGMTQVWRTAEFEGLKNILSKCAVLSLILASWNAKCIVLELIRTFCTAKCAVVSLMFASKATKTKTHPTSHERFVA